MVEPFRLKAWQLPKTSPGMFYTSARPGRSRGSQAKVPDRVVLDWVNGLPDSSEIYIISLLGEKPGGNSEFSFYSSFVGPDSFQEWLNARISNRRFHIISYPTIDLEPMTPAVLAAVSAEVRRLVSLGKIVVIVDSGGWTRTGTVAAYLNATQVAEL